MDVVVACEAEYGDEDEGKDLGVEDGEDVDICGLCLQALDNESCSTYMVYRSRASVSPIHYIGISSASHREAAFPVMNLRLSRQSQRAHRSARAHDRPVKARLWSASAEWAGAGGSGGALICPLLAAITL